MDLFEIEYAKMRQKELDKDMQAINVARTARPKDSKRLNRKAVVDVGNMLRNMGRLFKFAGWRTDKSFPTAVQEDI